METFIKFATELASGGIVLILVFLLLLAALGLKYLFDTLVAMATRTITAMEAQTQAMKEHTAAINTNAQVSTANREAIEKLREIFEVFINARRR